MRKHRNKKRTFRKRVFSSREGASQPTLRERIIALGANATGMEIFLTLMQDDRFWETLHWAVVIVVGGTNEFLYQEVAEETEWSIDRYFLDRGLTEYTDAGESEFRGWLFALCRRHARWALGHVLRRRRRYSDQEVLASLPSPPSLGEPVYMDCQEIVVATIRSFADPLRTVMQDYFGNVPRWKTAQALGSPV